MALHIATVVSTVRWYAREGGYERFEPSLTVCTLTWGPTGTVVISALHGRMTFSMWRELHDYLKAQGVENAIIERHHRTRILRERKRPESVDSE